VGTNLLRKKKEKKQISAVYFKNAHRILVKKPEMQRPLWRVNIRII
jgi:hypothetical protein